MGRLEELRVVDPVLTTLARGYVNAELVGIVLAPIAVVPKETGKIPQFGKDSFKLYNTERALRAQSNRLSPEGISTIDYVLTEHDVEYPIDYREAEEAIFDLQAHATETVQNIIMLRLEKDIADQAQTLANYPTGNKVTLSGTSQWTDTTNSDPIANIETAKDAVRGKIGRYPNVMVLGASAFKALKNHPKILDRVKYSMRAVITEELLQELLQIERIVVGKAVYASDAGTFTDIWADNAIFAYVPGAPGQGQRTPYAPAFAYTLRKSGKPEVDKRDEQGGKLHIVRCTDNLAVKLVGAEAGYIINDTNA